MQLLLFEWNGLMQRDLEDVLDDLHISYFRFSYCFDDIHKDDFFCSRFENHLKCHAYDAVISFNFFPLVAEACYRHGIKYIAWCYDSPVRVIPCDTFAYPTNYIFMFDKKEANEYRSKGFDTVRHMPLAVNTKRVRQLMKELGTPRQYKYDISFIGNMPKGNFLSFVAPLPAYYRGFLSALATAQPMFRNYYLPDDYFTPELLERLNECYKEYHSSISKENLSFLFGKYVTENERLNYLHALSQRFDMHLFSNTCPEQLTNIHYHGTARYYTEMSQIFAESRINFNSSLYSIRTGISLRLLDITAIGGFLLTNYQEEILDYYVPDRDLVIYTSIEDAVAKADFYLKSDSLREKIALSGMEVTQNCFSYEKQLAQMFHTAGLV